MQMTTWNFGKITVAFGLAGALLCAALSFIALPDRYTSVAVLRLTKSVLPGDSQPATDNAEEFVKNLIQDALARKPLADIINNRGLYPRERARNPMEDVVDRMRRDVSFERIGDSNSFHVSFRYSDAEHARRTEQDVINMLMSANVIMRRASSRPCPDLTGANGCLPDRGYNMEVLDPASLPKRPSSPNRFLIAATGLAGGLLLGALTAIVVRTRPSTAPAGNSPKSS